jgi:transcriptional regulator with XRE-family HTH domain
MLLTNELLIMENLGKRLEALRKSKRMSQKEFADELEVTQTTIGNYERGGRIPDSDFLQKVVQKMGTNYDWLLEGKGGMYEKAAAVAADTEQVELIKNSNRYLTMTIDLLIDKVKALGGDLPPSLGKLNSIELALVRNIKEAKIIPISGHFGGLVVNQ